MKQVPLDNFGRVVTCTYLGNLSKVPIIKASKESKEAIK